MKNHDLIGKTITGAIAVTPRGERTREIWMLQFSDGSHVEFVSPQAKRQLRRQIRQSRAPVHRPDNDIQLPLNVA